MRAGLPSAEWRTVVSVCFGSNAADQTWARERPHPV